MFRHIQKYETDEAHRAQLLQLLRLDEIPACATPVLRPLPIQVSLGSEIDWDNLAKENTTEDIMLEVFGCSAVLKKQV